MYAIIIGAHMALIDSTLPEPLQALSDLHADASNVAAIAEPVAAPLSALSAPSAIAPASAHPDDEDMVDMGLFIGGFDTPNGNETPQPELPDEPPSEQESSAMAAVQPSNGDHEPHEVKWVLSMEDFRK
jgi:hypothetical protein